MNNNKKVFRALRNFIIFIFVIISLINVLYPKDVISLNTKKLVNNVQTLRTIDESYLVEGEYYVDYVIDGDTFITKFNGVSKKVRLIGVNTPEITSKYKKSFNHFGETAAQYLKNKIEKKKVKLEFDNYKFDKYGRVLAYVYFENKMINENLVEIGYASSLPTSWNKKYLERFQTAQKRAKEKYLGIWSIK